YWSRFGNIEISPIHPHIKKPQSECFTGNNTWAHQYALKNNADWPEVTYDLESANYVIYNGEVNSQKNAGARIINKYRNEQA
ncbi:unnamed protein product, partial [Rotaria socialis]